jgi:UDP-glucose 4-epimerase
VKVAITGSRGFIGAHVDSALRADGHEVIHFDRADGNDILGSLDALDGAEKVIHLAGVLGTAELFDEPQTAIDVNVTGALRILEWCREHEAGYIGITMPPVFPSVYTATKICADRLAQAWHRAYGVPVAIVRAFNAFGPGQKFGPGHPQKVVPTFAVHGWQGKPLPVWGDGTQTMDLISAAQLGRLFADVIHCDDGATFDGGTGGAVSVNDLAHFVNQVTGNKAGIEYLPMRLGEEPTAIKATGEGWDRLSWRPWLDWGELAATVDWYRDMI